MIICHSVFNVWPKTTVLPVWPRDAKRLDTPGRVLAQYPSFGERSTWNSEDVPFA